MRTSEKSIFSKARRHFLLHLSSIFAQKNKEWQLDIVGEGDEESQFKALIQKYTISRIMKMRLRFSKPAVIILIILEAEALLVSCLVVHLD
jgi:hypothetical protein